MGERGYSEARSHLLLLLICHGLPRLFGPLLLGIPRLLLLAVGAVGQVGVLPHDLLGYSQRSVVQKRWCRRRLTRGDGQHEFVRFTRGATVKDMAEWRSVLLEVD